MYSISPRKAKWATRKSGGWDEEKKRYLFSNLFRASKKEIPFCAPLWTKNF
jgi:hypothetical protein